MDLLAADPLKTLATFDQPSVTTQDSLGGDPLKHELAFRSNAFPTAGITPFGSTLGADKAKIIVIAFEDPEKNISLVHTVQKHFPHLKIVVRAVDRGDANKLITSGINDVYRETIVHLCGLE